MSAWAKQAGERIREANDHTAKRRDWWIFRRNEIFTHGERLWTAIVKECQSEADCFNAELGSGQHPDAIQPFDGSFPFRVVIRQLYFPETRVECTLDREAREIAVVWFRKASHTSPEAQEREILEVDLADETGEIYVKRAGVPLTTNQVAELIVSPLMNRHHQPAAHSLAS